MDEVVLAVVQKSVEFAVCYLERSEFSGDDLSIQVCGFFSNLYLLGIVWWITISCVFKL